MQERVSPGCGRIGGLEQRLVETGTEIQQSIVDEAIEQWRNRSV